MYLPTHNTERQERRSIFSPRGWEGGGGDVGSVCKALALAWRPEFKLQDPYKTSGVVVQMTAIPSDCNTGVRGKWPLELSQLQQATWWRSRPETLSQTKTITYLRSGRQSCPLTVICASVTDQLCCGAGIQHSELTTKIIRWAWTSQQSVLLTFTHSDLP